MQTDVSEVYESLERPDMRRAHAESGPPAVHNQPAISITTGCIGKRYSSETPEPRATSRTGAQVLNDFSDVEPTQTQNWCWMLLILEEKKAVRVIWLYMPYRVWDERTALTHQKGT